MSDKFSQTMRIILGKKPPAADLDATQKIRITPNKMNVKSKRKEKVLAVLRKHEITAYASILVLSAAISGAAFYGHSLKASRTNELSVTASQVIPSMYQLRETTAGAINGNDAFFDGSKAVNDQVGDYIHAIADPTMDKSYENLLAASADVESGRKGIVLVGSLLATSANMEDEIDGILTGISNDSTSTAQKVLALQISSKLQKIKYSLATSLTSGSFTKNISEVALLTEDVLTKAESLFTAADKGEKEKVAKIIDLLEVIASNVDVLTVQASIVNKAVRASELVSSKSSDLEVASTAYIENAKAFKTNELLIAYAFGALAALFGVALIARYLMIIKNQESFAKKQNDENQSAIMSLMNDMSDIADGDLTRRAKVTAGMTGAIADSVNNTVEEVGNIVRMISTATKQIEYSTASSSKMANDLKDSAKKESQHITSLGSLIDMVDRSSADIDVATTNSASIASSAAQSAKTGSEAVSATIDGMGVIRDSIQDTSKRIKRLGESSQEIGDITELITNVADQTRVLALNAKLQAVHAGEAGRGFAVVAEEVQGLAERSSDAATKIGALVRLIQTDTHDAVTAMEKSTAGVVEGTKLSDRAGALLREIESVSEELNAAVGSIAVSTQNQREMTSEIKAEMNVLLGVVQRTDGAVESVTGAIGGINSYADNLQRSVARFKV